MFRSSRRRYIVVTETRMPIRADRLTVHQDLSGKIMSPANNVLCSITLRQEKEKR